MSDVPIMRLWPAASAGQSTNTARTDTALTDDEIAGLYAEPVENSGWARVNFVSSLDGAATHDGLSGGLSGDADKRVFDLLRTLCDVVVVGAGTVRAEGYGAMRVDAASEQRRIARGRAPQPVFALVSAGLDLDPASSIFTDAPVRPVVVTVDQSPPGRRDALAEVADVLVCGQASVDTTRMLQALAERGLTRVHCEGGPHLFATMIADGAVDELCLTLSPQVEGGSSRRITAGATPSIPARMRLAHVLVAGDTLLLRYVRARQRR